MKKKELTVTELAAKGGNANFKKHGKKHYRKMAQKRWSKIKKTK